MEELIETAVDLTTTKHKFIKVMIGAAASFAVTKGVEKAYDAAVTKLIDRKTN